MEAMYTVEKSLVEKVNEMCQAQGISKAALAEAVGVSRSLVSQYLSGKYTSNPEKVEASLKEWMEGKKTRQAEGAEAVKELVPEKPALFKSRDYIGVFGICDVCQKYAARGIVVGKSGFGKTYALQSYAKLPRVLYIECNENMNAKDLIRRMERALGMPKTYGSIDERLDYIINFFNTNKGYLLIVDEADKLISKYAQKKIEILRYITDTAPVGVIMAGEPALESAIKAYDKRLENRIDFYYKLSGLNREELKRYFEGFAVEEAAMHELELRSMNQSNGCFRLLDRTLNNVIRIMKEQRKATITMSIIKEASGMMML